VKPSAQTGGVSRKPKKELLMPMLRHLVAKFQVSVACERCFVCVITS